MEYVALGDSITIDEYPDQEVGTEGNGAASCFWRLLQEHEEFKGYTNVAADGALISSVIKLQLPRVKHLRNREVLVTVTMGGNDISFGVMQMERERNLFAFDRAFDHMMNKIMFDYARAVLEIKMALPRATIITNTLYDPTDGTGILPESCGKWADIAPQYSVGRRQLGQYIRRWSKKYDFIACADVFDLFRVQGMKSGNYRGFYYDRFMIEPGAEGAKRIAALWLQTYRSVTKQEEQEDDRVAQRS